jgi:ribulose-phosphate 3-epimerase
MRIQILPSLLAADVGHLEDGARRAESSGANALHLDIMDAHFVPNLSMGPTVVEMAKRVVRIPLSVHLMMTRPDQYLKRFIEAGADSLLIHIEAECDVPEALGRIRELGAQPGITLNPETPAELVFPVLGQVREILCMTVHPGYGGQAFMAEVVPKIRVLRDRAKADGKDDLDILVDGGIDAETVQPCAAAGANAFIAGTSLYRAEDMAAAVKVLREKAAASLVL